MKSALEGISAVATSREEAEWGCFSQVATGFRPHRAFRVSRPPEDKDAASLAMLPEKGGDEMLPSVGKVNQPLQGRTAWQMFFIRSSSDPGERHSFFLYLQKRITRNESAVFFNTNHIDCLLSIKCTNRNCWK
ncbi:MAG: hypothetical protein J6O01_03515 [Bacteroidales bacterium]|nr:hypothetical protein [Bacteroidales bacterium]